MKFFIPFLGKTKEKYLDDAIKDYTARLCRYASVELPVLKERHIHGAPDEITQSRQAEELLASCGQNRYKVALDAKGRLMSSEELASKLTAWEEQGAADIAFFIGGHLGLHGTALKSCDFHLALSPLTFTHEMARFLLLEQLYRACTIRAGHRYHL
jgi:23S rRNA (pseudouridine1915-N3)-methyltransferase